MTRKEHNIIDSLMRENPNDGRRKPHTLGRDLGRRGGSGTRATRAPKPTLTPQQMRALRAAQQQDAGYRHTADVALMATMGTIHQEV